MLFPGQAVDSALFHAPPFKAPSGGGLGKPPTNSVEKGQGQMALPFLSPKGISCTLQILMDLINAMFQMEILNYEWSV
jgi:hypothetical protein